MNKLIYTGIGSRNAPEDVLELCTLLGQYMANFGWILRSGGAEGCDNAFEIGCDISNGVKEIYLPWKNFNNNKSNLYSIPCQAYETIKDFHPNPNTIKGGTIKLMARNSQQVLGQQLTEPSKLVIFYAPVNKKGKIIGGTGQAIRIANHYNIPTINLYNNKLNINDVLNKITIVRFDKNV